MTRQFLTKKCSVPLFVGVQLCLTMQICFVQFYFLEPSWKWHKQHWQSSSQTSTAANCTVPAFQSAAYVTDPTTRKVLRGATPLNFQSSSVITLFSSTLKLDAIGCLNYYRCSRTNWDHYTLHQANFFPARQSIKNEGAAGAGAGRQGRKRDWCSFQIAPEICWVFPGAQILHHFCARPQLLQQGRFFTKMGDEQWVRGVTKTGGLPPDNWQHILAFLII